MAARTPFFFTLLSTVLAANRTALFWLVPYTNLTTVEQYMQAWGQFATYAAPGYVLAGSAYALKHNGSLGYADTTAGEGLDGVGMELLGFPALQRLVQQANNGAVPLLAMTYLTHIDGLNIMLKDPQPFVDALIAKVVQNGLGGVDIDYEPQAVDRAVARLRADSSWTATAPDPFFHFLGLLANATTARGLFLSIDIGGSCAGLGSADCMALAQLPGLNQVNTEDTFGISSLADFQAAEAANAGAGLAQRWAPGFEPGNIDEQLYETVLEYAASTAGNVSRMATWAIHEYNVGPQPEYLFQAVNAFLGQA